MSYATAFYTLLAADATLTGLLTGGLYNHGLIDETNLPAGTKAANGRLKPFAVVKGRSLEPGDDVFLHPGSGVGPYIIVRQVVEVWMYDDRDATLTALETAAKRVVMVAQYGPVSGAFSSTLRSWLPDIRAGEYNDARMMRLDFLVVGRIKP